MWKEYIGKIIKVEFVKDNQHQLFKGIYLGDIYVSGLGKPFKGLYVYGSFQSETLGNLQLIDLMPYKQSLTQESMSLTKTTPEFSFQVGRIYTENNKRKREYLEQLKSEKESKSLTSILKELDTKNRTIDVELTDVLGNKETLPLIALNGYYTFIESFDKSINVTEELDNYFMTKETIGNNLKKLHATFGEFKVCPKPDSIIERLAIVNQYVSVETLAYTSHNHKELIRTIMGSGQNYLWKISNDQIYQLEFFLYSKFFRNEYRIDTFSKEKLSIGLGGGTISFELENVINPINNKVYSYHKTYDSLEYGSGYISNPFTIPYIAIQDGSKKGHFQYLPKGLLSYICDPTLFNQQLLNIHQTLTEKGIKLSDKKLQTIIRDLLLGKSKEVILDSLIKKEKPLTSKDTTPNEKRLLSKSFNSDKLEQYIHNYVKKNWEDIDITNGVNDDDYYEDDYEDDYESDYVDYSLDITDFIKDIKEYIVFYQQNGLEKTRTKYKDKLISTGYFRLDTNNKELERDFVKDNVDSSDTIVYKGLIIDIEFESSYDSYSSSSAFDISITL